MFLRNISLVFVVLLSSVGYSQNDLSSLQLPNSWAALSANPAVQPQGILVSLPEIYNNLWVSNITIGDLITDDNGTDRLDIQGAINQMGTENILAQQLDINTVGVAFQLGPVGLHIGHRLRIDGSIAYPKTLAQTIWEGNSQFIGQTVSLAPSFDVFSYHELSLGANIAVTDFLTIGARAKLLGGIAALQSEGNQLDLTTSDDIYQLELDADYRVNSAGVLNYESLRNVGLDFNTDEFSLSDLFGDNSGLAFDIGIAVDFENWHFQASALDLGAEIEWKDNPRNYTFNGNYEFTGLDIARDLLDDDANIGNITDSLFQQYEPIETNSTFSTQLRSRYYFGAQHDLSEALTIGIVGYTDDYTNGNTFAVAATGSMELSKILRVGAMYGLRNERADNLGLNATVSLGPVRLLIATDNVISAFRPRESQLANFRLGVNLHFGQEEENQ